MKTKIAIVGTGGVGGFLGGLLARRYRDDPEVDIYFISRGQALENIRSRGLIVESQQGNFRPMISKGPSGRSARPSGRGR